MNFDSDFLYEYLTADNGRIWSEPIDLLMFDWYRDINNGTIEETVMPKEYKFFLENYYWKEKNEIIANDICSKVDSKKIPYYFSNFTFGQLSVIFFGICYGLEQEQLSLFCKRGMTVSNMSCILYLLITAGNDNPNLIQQISENFKGRFSQSRFECFVREHQISSKIPNV